MPTLLVHPDVAAHLSELDVSIRDFVDQKVSWSKMQLAMHGRVSRVKGTRTQAWRRTPVRGNQYYLWWAPAVEVGASEPKLGPAIAVRDLRHHDDLTPPAPATHSAYEIVHPGDIDPRTRLQALVAKPASSTGISATIVRGQPGTGKTLSLLYAARGMAASKRVLYITYTHQLAEDALLFSKTVGMGDNFVVMTLSSLIAAILSDPPDAKIENPDAMARGFESMIRGLDSSVVGAWATKGVALWAEARANIIGMALPFAWKRGPLTIPACDLLDLPLYCEMSGLDREPAEKARHLADLARKRGLLSDQTRARAALEMLIKGSAGRLVVEGVQSVMLDEAQDLTPVEFALLLEMTRHVGKSHEAVHFLAAGDESQTVHPSGFEWGIAKDLIRERLGREPKEIGLGQMMRNPGVIHTIIKNTSSLYKNLPKSFRPSGGMADDSPPVQDVGQVFRCLLPKGGREALLDTLVALPGRALVQLEKAAQDTRQPAATKASGKTKNDPWASVTFTPAEIKGLERRIVVVTGLDEALGTIQRLTQCEVQERRSLESLEARYLIDGIRVALSRATDTLIVVEQDSAPTASPALTKDLMPRAESIQWDELLVLLEKDDLSDEERAYVFLAEAREFAQRDDTGRALERLERAEAVTRDLTDETLSGMLRELRRHLEKKAGLRIVVAPSGGDFDDLQEAIDKAPEGATLYIRPGTYVGPFMIEKNLKMVADGPQQEVVLDGDRAAVLVKNGHVTLDGLAIALHRMEGQPKSASTLVKQVGRRWTDSLGWGKTGAMMKELGALLDGEAVCVGVGIVKGKLEMRGCEVRGAHSACIVTIASLAHVMDCSLHLSKTGISIGTNSTVTIERTTVHDVHHGIDTLGNVRLVVRDSTFRDIVENGISLATGTEALIERNTLHAHQFGMAVHVGVEVLVRKNRFQGCYGGIKVYEGGGGVYEENEILQSVHVGFWGAADCDPTLRNNRIRDGGMYGIFLDGKARGRYEENQIVGNGDTAFMFYGENQVVVRNSLIQGNAKTNPSVFVGGGTVGIFELNEISGTQGNGVALVVDAGEGFVVRKNRIHHHPRQGLSIRGKGCLFEENEIHDVVNVGVMVENSGSPIMSRNQIHHNGFGIIIHEGSSGVFEDNEIHSIKDTGVLLKETTPIFRRNRIHHCVHIGAAIEGPSEALFEQNEIGECGNAANDGNVKIVKANPVFRGNTIRGGSNGMAFLENSQGTADGNDISSPSRIGIFVTENSKPTLRGNRIHGSKTHGVVIENGDGTIENNEIFKNQGTGLRVESNDAMIRDNRIHGNMAGGIAVLSKKGTFERNQILYNQPWGFLAAQGSNPNVQENLVQGSAIGLIIGRKTGGTYVKNDLRGNMQIGLLVDPNSAPNQCDDNALDDALVRGPTDKYHSTGPSPAGQGKKKGKGK